MTHESERRRDRDPQVASIQRGNHPPQVLQLGGKGVVTEALREREAARVVHSTATQIERDRGYPGPREALGERRPHSPILESLESVDGDDGGPGSVATSGSDIDVDVSENAGNDVSGKGGCSHGST